MKIAIITGASAGLGLELTARAAEVFPEIEEFWLLARNEDRLKEAIVQLLPGKAVALPLDLRLDEALGRLEEKLREEKPEILLLINGAGCGYLNNVGDGPLEEQLQMVDLNIRGLTAVTHLCIPHMAQGGRIINISSIASFCPNPRMSVYSSSKAFVSSFSRGIAEELKPRNISVTCVCPGPMDTPFLSKGRIKGQSKTFDVLPYSDPKMVAKGALRASFHRRHVYTPKFFYKLFRFVAKLLPQSLMIKFTKT